MYISKLRVRNFRCFGPQFTEIGLEKLTAFIGGNGHGKTATMHALLKLFGIGPRDRHLERADFHLPHGKDPSEISKIDLQVEAVIDFPELTSEEEEAAGRTVPDFFRHMIVESAGSPPYVRIQLSATWEKGHTPDGVIDQRIDFVCTDELDVELEDSCRHKCPPSILAKIQMLYVPAMRDPAIQLKYQTNTLIGQILGTLRWSDELRASLKEKVGGINSEFKTQDGIKAVASVLNRQWGNFVYGDKFTEAELNFVSLELESLLKGIEFRFKPTHTESDYSVGQLGDGLQSLFYLSLVTSVLELQANILRQPELFDPDYDLPVLTLVALEEPENHLSPHLLGKTVANFLNISELENAQVVFTSHAPSIFKRIDPTLVRYFGTDRTTHQPRIREIPLPLVQSEAYTFVKEAVRAYPELYFAKFVVLGEGESEEVLLPRFLSAFGRDLDSEFISVVPLGGRHVNHFWKLLTAIEVPFATLLDLDLERNTGGWARIKYVLDQLIENGTDKAHLLEVETGSIDLATMHTWDISSSEALQSWIDFLESHNVFFSQPLDIDFLMLSEYESHYKALIRAPRRGPELPEDSDDHDEFIADVICSVLKSKSATGKCYSESDYNLFNYYRYFFFGRSKPVTHLEFLSEINDEELYHTLPTTLSKLMNYITVKVKGAAVTTEILGKVGSAKSEEPIGMKHDTGDEIPF